MDFCISDECTFGDFKGLLRPSMQTCAEMVRDSPWMCYPGRGGEHCCASCARIANKENAGKHSLIYRNVEQEGLSVECKPPALPTVHSE